GPLPARTGRGGVELRSGWGWSVWLPLTAALSPQARGEGELSCAQGGVGVCGCPSPRPSPRKDGERGSWVALRAGLECAAAPHPGPLPARTGRGGVELRSGRGWSVWLPLTPALSPQGRGEGELSCAQGGVGVCGCPSPRLSPRKDRERGSWVAHRGSLRARTGRGRLRRCRRPCWLGRGRGWPCRRREW